MPNFSAARAGGPAPDAESAHHRPRTAIREQAVRLMSSPRSNGALDFRSAHVASRCAAPPQGGSRGPRVRQPFSDGLFPARLRKLIAYLHPHPVLGGTRTDILQGQRHVDGHPGPAVQAVHETALGLAEAGVMAKRTMRAFGDMCLMPVEEVWRYPLVTIPSFRRPPVSALVPAGTKVPAFKPVVDAHERE